MLHIRCGDDILDRLKEAGLPGARMRWADPLCQGPTPAGLAPQDWRDVRARHAVACYDVTYDEALHWLIQQDEQLERYRDHDRIVLWFEHDLFDQIILVYLLTWFAEHNLDETKLLLVLSGEHLGYMDPSELMRMYATQRPVTPIQMKLAQEAWRAYCSPDPTVLHEFLYADTTALPYLGKALRRHLQEYPSVEDGLCLTERYALEAIMEGETHPQGIFESVQDREESAWLGDRMFWPFLDRLAGSPEPLVTIEGDGPWPDSSTMRATSRRVRPTRRAQAVLAGQDDWMRTDRLDRWLGGVHLVGEHRGWRWDGRRERLVNAQG